MTEDSKKSLKYFLREDAIKKEVVTWRLYDCKQYLKKHKKDTGSLMKKKRALVEKFQKALETKLFALSGNERQEMLEDVPFEFILAVAPKEVKDPPNKKLPTYQKNTGVYLWSLGYDLKKFVGAGCSAVVWELDNNKVMRVACNRKYLGFFNSNDAVSEIKDNDRLNEIIGENINKNKKHLSTSEKKDSPNKSRAVFESELASHGNLQSFKGTKDYSKDIANVLQMASDALKGLQTIHAKGYSHNDIKPDNILVTDKNRKEKHGGGSRKNLKIADFGAMTKISKTWKIFTNRKFHAPDFWKLSNDAVAKRDIYSIGCIFLGLLMNDTNFSNNYQSLAKELVSKGSKNFFDTHLKTTYSDNQKSLIIDFLTVVQKMVQPNHQDRIDYADALKKIRKLKDDIKEAGVQIGYAK